MLSSQNNAVRNFLIPCQGWKTELMKLFTNVKWNLIRKFFLQWRLTLFTVNSKDLCRLATYSSIHLEISSYSPPLATMEKVGFVIFWNVALNFLLTFRNFINSSTKCNWIKMNIFNSTSLFRETPVWRKR